MQPSWRSARRHGLVADCQDATTHAWLCNDYERERTLVFTLRKTVLWMVALLLGSGQFAVAGSPQDGVKPVPERQITRQVHVKVGKAVSIAIGTDASARMHIADDGAQPPDNHTGTVQVDAIYDMAIAPGASACVRIPLLEGIRACDTQEHDNTAQEK